MAKQANTSKSTATKGRKRPPAKPRAPRKTRNKAPVADAAAVPVVVSPPAPDSVVVVSELRETAEILDGLRSQRDELRTWMAETGESLAELRRQRAEIGDLAELKRTLEASRSEFEALLHQAEDTRRAIADVRACDSVVETRTEVVSPVVQAVPISERALVNSTVPAHELLPEVGALSVEDLPTDAPERLVRYLNDAWIIEKEQIDLIQSLADAAQESELKAELEEHRMLSQDQQQALGERLRVLGVRPSGGRSFLGTIATHVWDAIQGHGREGDDSVELLLKATSAVELEAAIYLVVYSIARATGDEETAELAALHLRQEREFADRLRKRMIDLTIRPSPVPVA